MEEHFDQHLDVARFNPSSSNVCSARAIPLERGARAGAERLTRAATAMQYRPEIDGLRTLAVLPVILFHAGFDLFSGGFVGVDVFFVISGYLITSIILAELAAGQFTLTSFYERRARRILPALIFVMLICIPFAWLWMSPRELKDFAQSVVAVSFFASNILFWLESGYFNGAAELKPLLHTWSLAVEEQYYVLFPLFLMLTWRRGKRWILVVLALVAVSSLGFAEWSAHRYPDAAFYLLPFRIWELLLGAFAALHLAHSAKALAESRPMLGQFMAGAGLVCIAYGVFAFDELTPFPGLNALAPATGALLIILFGIPSTFVGRLLATRPMVKIGLISYSAYLWHQPLFAFARLRSPHEPASWLFITLALASLVLAYLTWRHIEWPFRDRRKLSRKTIFAAAAFASVLLVSIGSLTHLKNGFYDHSRLALSTEDRALFDIIEKHTRDTMITDMPDNGACMFWQLNVDDKFIHRFGECAKKHGPALIILGDSHAMNIYGALYRNNAAEFLVGVAQGHCRPHANLPNCHYDAFEKFSREHAQDIKQVLYNQAGFYLLKDTDGGNGSRKMFRRANIELHPVDEVHIQKTVEYLEKISRTVKVTWLGPFLELHFSRRSLFELLQDGYRIDPNLAGNYERLDDELAAHVARGEYRFQYRSLFDAIKFGERINLVEGDCLVFRDGDHLSTCGERLVGTIIKEALTLPEDTKQAPRQFNQQR